MLPLCCLSPCCLCSGFQPIAPLWLRAHTLGLSQRLPGKNTGSFATKRHKELRGKVFLGQSAFLPILPIPPEFCLPNCWKWSPTSRVILKNSCPVAITKMDIKGHYLLYFLRGKGRSMFFYEVCPQQTSALTGKDIEKIYRSAMSLHKSDKNVV